MKFSYFFTELKTYHFSYSYLFLVYNGFAWDKFQLAVDKMLFFLHFSAK